MTESLPTQGLCLWCGLSRDMHQPSSVGMECPIPGKVFFEDTRARDAAPTSKMRLNADRLMELKQSPRSADVTDIEDLCDEVERLRTVLETIANYSGKTEPALLLKYLAEAALKSPAETIPKDGA